MKNKLNMITCSVIIYVLIAGFIGCVQRTDENGEQSSNADLSALTISSGTLSPAFDSAVTSYTVTVTDITSATVTPTAAHSNADITVNTVAVESGSASESINLSMGSNIITIEATAEDGVIYH